MTGQAQKWDISAASKAPAEKLLGLLIGELLAYQDHHRAIQTSSLALVEAVRQSLSNPSLFYAFLEKYPLSSNKGRAIMSLIEAFLRIPDQETAYLLIYDKLTRFNWEEELGPQDPLFVKIGVKGFSFIKKQFLNQYLEKGTLNFSHFSGFMKLMAPVLYTFMKRLIQHFSHEFVMAPTMDKAMKKAQKSAFSPYLFSYDMLGESARTYDMANMYFQSYDNALTALTFRSKPQDPFLNSGLSLKLSALHPRYDFRKKDLLMKELAPKIYHFCRKAKEAHLNITIDAEETQRLGISLDLIEAVLKDSSLQGWNGFSMAVQAYQKSAYFLIDKISDLAHQTKQRIGVRLVKGAYWDYEIKYSQQNGFEEYPVFTRKSLTDISYLACASKLLKLRPTLYPMFATHNAHTVTSILHMCGLQKSFEFQKLYGMGNELYDHLLKTNKLKIPVRIYAPIGPYQDLLPYLVRRLLENGANTSFVSQMGNKNIPIKAIIQNPLVSLNQVSSADHPGLRKPYDLFLPERCNSKGVDLSDVNERESILKVIDKISKEAPWKARSLIHGNLESSQGEKPLPSPRNYSDEIGLVTYAADDELVHAYHAARRAEPLWRLTSALDRAVFLEKTAELMEKQAPKLLTLCIMEGGKTLEDALSEIREAVDFLRYYAAEGVKTLSQATSLKGYTGESNTLHLEGRGIFVAISPWNFPLAIFVGQISAALMAGNVVLAKPSDNTPLLAYHATKIFHEAGIPTDVLQLLLAPGKKISSVILEPHEVEGLVFTGSTATAHAIQQTLAKQRKIAPFIAETGGINAMIADSTSLPEQVADAAVRSAFQSAGQRCSALRLLFVQDDIADSVITLIKGSMDTLKVGDPMDLDTDIGPLINFEAKKRMLDHVEKMKKVGEVLHVTPSAKDVDGPYFMPHLILLKDSSDLTEEVFGPILHVVRFKKGTLDSVIDSINKTGYGLTLGVQTRITETADYIKKRARVGNIYINRDMIGAVVGVQPFGGQGLSGTGPKAGGPHYLTRFTVEKTVTDNTMASGGNVDLINLKEA